MLEKDMENLIAEHPDEFFPASGFILKGQQISLGRCRADIIFSDKYERLVIIEVKRGILSREAAGQIIEYYGLLKKKEPDKIIELVLCANVVPNERRTFLENNGIECKEIPISQIIGIAKKFNYLFLDDTSNHKKKEKYIIPGINKGSSSIAGQQTWIFQANPLRYDILNALYDPECNLQRWTVSRYKNHIKRGDLVFLWMSGKDGGIYAVAEVLSEPREMEDLPGESKYWIDQDDEYNKECLKVELRVIKNLVNRPLFRTDLKKMITLTNLSIFRQPQGTNFYVSPEEGEIILKLTNDK